MIDHLPKSHLPRKRVRTPPAGIPAKKQPIMKPEASAPTEDSIDQSKLVDTHLPDGYAYLHHSHEELKARGADTHKRLHLANVKYKMGMEVTVGAYTRIYRIGQKAWDRLQKANDRVVDSRWTCPLILHDDSRPLNESLKFWNRVASPFTIQLKGWKPVGAKPPALLGEEANVKSPAKMGKSVRKRKSPP